MMRTRDAWRRGYSTLSLSSSLSSLHHPPAILIPCDPHMTRKIRLHQVLKMILVFDMLATPTPRKAHIIPDRLQSLRQRSLQTLANAHPPAHMFPAHQRVNMRQLHRSSMQSTRDLRTQIDQLREQCA